MTTDSARTSGGWRRTLAANKVIIIAMGVPALLATALFTAFWWLQRDSAAHAEVGDCLAAEAGGEAYYRVEACGSDQAKYKVLARYAHGDSRYCEDVAGASRRIEVDDVRLCIADKGVNPATAINVAKEGDCVHLDGSDAQRLDCADAKATYKVLKRTNMSNLGVKTNGPCADVPGTEESYTWRWRDQDSTDPLANKVTVDIVLCLGKK